MDFKRLIVITGHYGSGKTEFALNLAVKLKNQGKKVIIVDLDIVNPYFRTNDAKKKLEAMGIRVIAPEFAGTNLDLPSLPSEIYTTFEDKDSTVVFDVGGDEQGAVALGRFNAYFNAQGYDMFVVMNTKRPLTQTESELVDMLNEIQSASRLKATGLVNNTHLMGLTTSEDVLSGHDVIKSVSEKTVVPIRFVSAMGGILKDIKIDENTFEMEKFLFMP